MKNNQWESDDDSKKEPDIYCKICKLKWGSSGNQNILNVKKRNEMFEYKCRREKTTDKNNTEDDG